MHHPTDRIAHTTACYTSRGALAGTRNSSVHPMKDRATKELSIDTLIHPAEWVLNKNTFSNEEFSQVGGIAMGMNMGPS